MDTQRLVDELPIFARLKDIERGLKLINQGERRERLLLVTRTSRMRSVLNNPRKPLKIPQNMRHGLASTKSGLEGLVCLQNGARP